LRQVIGIDFSGSADQWKPGRKTSNVWIAMGSASPDGLSIAALRPVQALPGEGHPFERLSALLAASTDAVAGIDAPFSVPRSHALNPRALWERVAALPSAGRPFAQGQALVECLAVGPDSRGRKLLRACESHWSKQGLNPRSTLWNGVRPGAPFAVACMTLLHRHPGPVWPFKREGRGALLVEAYPAAQLRTWSLNPHGYGGAGAQAREARAAIAHALVRRHGLQVSDDALRLCIASPDALDAVLCAYGAKALAEGRHPRRLPPSARTEGWVVVDSEPGRERTPAPPAAPACDERLVDLATEQAVRRAFDRVFAALGAETP